MFLTTNNEFIGSLKSPQAMVFSRKRTVGASASRLFVPFVRSELGYKTTSTSSNSAIWSSTASRVIVLTVAQKGMN